MNNLFDFSLSRWDARARGSFRAGWNPAIDIVDSKDNIHVKADIPGINKDDLDVSIEGDRLIIKGEKKKENEIIEKNYFRTERAYGSFSRAVFLPVGVDATKVRATYKNGVMELMLPKKEGVKPWLVKIDIK